MPVAPSTATVPRVVLYSRVGCCLCDEAERALTEAGRRFEVFFEVVEVDVVGGEALQRFGDHVPVLEIDGEVVLRHRIDAGSLNRCLRGRLAGLGTGLGWRARLAARLLPWASRRRRG